MHPHDKRGGVGIHPSHSGARAEPQHGILIVNANTAPHSSLFPGFEKREERREIEDGTGGMCGCSG